MKSAWVAVLGYALYEVLLELGRAAETPATPYALEDTC